MRKIGELLIEKGFISVEQLNLAIEEQRRTGEDVGKILVKKGFLNDDQFLLVLSQQLNIPYVKLKDVSIDKHAIKKVPAKFVWHYKLMPLAFEEGRLVIATFDPLHALDDVRLFLGFEVKAVLASETDIVETIKQHYGVGSEIVEGIMAKAPKEERSAQESHLETKVEDIEKSAEDASVVKLVNQIILDAFQRRATDIHIEPFRNKMRIRYRIDGILYNASTEEETK